MTYDPNRTPDRLEELPGFLRQEFVEIKKALLARKPFGEFAILTSPPKRFRPGMVVYANGVDWNPGSGEGIYRRDETNSIWVFVG